MSARDIAHRHYVFDFYNNIINKEVEWFETSAELIDYRYISTGSECLHLALRAGVCNHTEIVHLYSSFYATTNILYSEGPLFFVVNEAHSYFILGIKNAFFSKPLIAHLVERTKRIWDQLREQDLFVQIGRVNDQAHQLVDFSSEFYVSFSGTAALIQVQLLDKQWFIAVLTERDPRLTFVRRSLQTFSAAVRLYTMYA